MGETIACATIFFLLLARSDRKDTSIRLDVFIDNLSWYTIKLIYDFALTDVNNVYDDVYKIWLLNMIWYNTNRNLIFKIFILNMNLINHEECSKERIYGS